MKHSRAGCTRKRHNRYFTPHTHRIGRCFTVTAALGMESFSNQQPVMLLYFAETVTISTSALWMVLIHNNIFIAWLMSIYRNTTNMYTLMFVLRMYTVWGLRFVIRC